MKKQKIANLVMVLIILIIAIVGITIAFHLRAEQ